MICICICIVQVFEVIFLCANNVVDLLFLINYRSNKKFKSFPHQFFPKTIILGHIVKPGKDPLLFDSYRPINLLTCGYCLSYSVWFEKSKRNTRDCLSLLTTDIRQRTIMFSYIKGDQLRLRSIEYKFRNVLFYQFQFQYQYFHENKQLCKFYFSPKRVLVLLIENSRKPYIIYTVWCDARKGATFGNCPIFVETAVV
jgi:hypothetical protein